MADDKTGLTIFLLKQDQVPAFEASLLAGTEGRQLQLAGSLDGTFLPLPAPSRAPGWIAAVRGILASPDALDLRSQFPAGLLVLRRSGRTYVITFGSAWMKLKDKWLEPDFGRRVSLNAISEDQLIEIRAEQVFAKWHLASERAPTASSVEEFGVEFDRDLVAVVEGTSSEAMLGKRIRGGTSLRITVPVADLGAILDKTTALFASVDYKKHWPDIDNVRPVKDQKLMLDLEAQLDTDLASGNGARKIVMFTPYQRHGDSASPGFVDTQFSATMRWEVHRWERGADSVGSSSWRR